MPAVFCYKENDMSNYTEAIKQLTRSEEGLDALTLADNQLYQMIEAYGKCMNSICKEIDLIKEILDKKNISNQQIIIETCALSMRKIIENVGFALMSARSKELDEKYRNNGEEWNYKKEWRFSKIISVLKGLNLNYKMKHKVLRPIVHADISFHGVERHSKKIDGVGLEAYMDDPQVVKTLGDLEKQYDFYSKYIHAQNPYNLEPISLNRLLQKLDKDVGSLIDFLNVHIIYIYEESGLAISCKFKISEGMGTTVGVKLIQLKPSFNGLLCEVDRSIEGQ